MANLKFDIFTFQLSPTTHLQLDLFGQPYSKDDLVRLKNKFFYDVLLGELKFRHRHKILSYKIEYKSKDFILLRLANKKTVSIEKQFHRASFESEPSCLVAIYNDPHVQLMAIESDKTSFGTSFTVVKILETTLTRLLEKLNLNMVIRPQYEEKEFWQLVERFEGRIEKLVFEFSYPNLPRVNKYLTDELKDTSKILNSAKTKVQFAAPDDQSLENLNEDNKELANFVKVSASGAGPAKLKIKNYKQWETTDNKVKSTEFEELEIDAPKGDIKEYIEAFKSLLKNV